MAKKKPSSKKKPAETPATLPVKVVTVSPISGTPPPAEYQWTPGQSGNPGGRKTMGASIKEWWNSMADWKLVEVQAVLFDADAPTAKRAAARAIIHACSDELTAGGLPVAGNDLERIIEHTAGRATQAVELSGPNGGPIPAAEAKKPMDYDGIERELHAIATATAAVAGRAQTNG